VDLVIGPGRGMEDLYRRLSQRLSRADGLVGVSRKNLVSATQLELNGGVAVADRDLDQPR
jgi:hypothetical protein